MLAHWSLIAILVIFALGGAAMFTRRLPSLLALPGMALGISLVALIRWEHHLSALAAPGFAQLAAGAGAMGREATLVAAGMAGLTALLWMALRETYLTTPVAGRALALLAVGLAVARALVGARAPLPPTRPEFALLALHGAVTALAAWWALGGAEGSDAWPDRLCAVLLGLAICLAGAPLLSPCSAHWYYRGQLAPVKEVALGLARDLDHILRGVLHEGALRLSSNYVIIIFGSMLAVFLGRTGLAREIVKTAAELGGDRPRVLAAVMLVVVAVLFTTLSGLGSIIMVGMIVLPLLLSLEAAPEVAASLLLMGISLGGILNPANWNLYLEVFEIPRADVLWFSGPLCGLGLGVASLFIWREFPAAPDEESAGGAPGSVPLPDASVRRRPLARLKVAAGSLLVIQPGGLRPVMVLVPLVPLVLILGLGVPEVPAFVLTLLAGTALYAGPRRCDLLVNVMLEGLAGVAPAVVILMGLGMLLKALTLPVATLAGVAGAPAAVPQIVAPVVRALVPATPSGYVMVFTLLAPLALYRGPLNVWGMGLGLAEVIRSAGTLGAPLVMGMLQSVGQIQGICDPTNTANIWVAGHARVTTRRILMKTFPYALLLAFAGLLLASRMFRPHFGSAL